ncbi:MAG: hypothetical protein ACJAXM_000980 [Arenicella sp.]|jgi:hypothetical protein
MQSKTPATVNINADQLNGCGTEIKVILNIISGTESIVMLGAFDISKRYKNLSLFTPERLNHLSQLVFNNSTHKHL